MECWKIILNIILEFLKSLPIILKNRIDTLPSPPKIPKKKSTIIISSVLIVSILLSFGAYAFLSNNKTDVTPTPIVPIPEPIAPTPIIEPIIITFDSDSFYKKYYNDPLIKFTSLPTTLADFKAIRDSFVSFEGANFSKNESIENSSQNVKELLNEASKLEKSKLSDIDTKRRIASLRASSYDLCKNNEVAYLAGNAFQNLFVSVLGEHEKNEFAKEAIQYFVRSILLSDHAYDTENISKCCKAIGDTYTILAEQEEDFSFKLALYLKIVLYLSAATHYYAGSLYFSYHSLCNSLATAYCNLLAQYKRFEHIEPSLIEYYYTQSDNFYQKALSQIIQLTPAEETQYIENHKLLHTHYNDYKNYLTKQNVSTHTCE